MQRFGIGGLTTLFGICAWLSAAGGPTDEVTHWAFTRPFKPELPSLADASWPRHPLDRFVLAQLETRGLEPAEETSRASWLRRVSFDLTGLPPTPAELDAFLNDEGEEAYGRVVERLFDSPAYGEHMATAWLDAARYADTHGYHYDNERSMWPWRDWVVQAFGDNMPFDQFTVEQLAGDLLPDATPAQRIATGFHRNHPINWEGGIIPEEYLNEYVVDRVGTTATVWMGLTMECARCHDHKYDPISQEEYYAFYDFFHQVPEKGQDGLEGNAEPMMRVTTPELEAELEAAGDAEQELQARVDGPLPELDAQELVWQELMHEELTERWQVLTPFGLRTEGATELEVQDDGSVFAAGELPYDEIYEVVAFTDVHPIRALRLEALADERHPAGGPGRASHSNFLLGELEVEVAPIERPNERLSITFDHAVADFSQRRFDVKLSIDGDPQTGWAVEGRPYGEDRVAVFRPEESFGFEGGTALRIRLHFTSSYTQHSIGRFRLALSDDVELGRELEPTTLGEWGHAGPFPPAANSDLGRMEAVWNAATDFVDGKVNTLPTSDSGFQLLVRELHAPSARQVLLSLGSDDGLELWLNGESLLQKLVARGAELDQDQLHVRLRKGTNHLRLAIHNEGGPTAFAFDLRADHAFEFDPAIEALLARRADERTKVQAARLRRFFRQASSAEWRAVKGRLEEQRARVAALEEGIPSTMVMGQLDQRRPTFVLDRGQYDRPGTGVSADVPAILPALAEDAERSRLTLARWLVDPAHPLTARVAVNRFWQELFGNGLLETSEDFGTRSPAPSHPELLDWLAVDFVESGWDVQALLRAIVTSATYRQSSKASQELAQEDPANRWLARGARVRLTAEEIRDAALAVSGLLVERLGGPPVKPYQPPGLWEEVGSDFAAFSANRYIQSEGEGLYRRSLYTFRKRSVPPPAFLAFDAPTREFCSVRRMRTNTPLQALVTLNDPTYVEAARALAERVLGGAEELDARLSNAFRRVLSREPEAAEREVLEQLLSDQHTHYQSHIEDARALNSVGASQPTGNFEAAELAAWTVLCSALFNLDETLTKT